MFSFSIFVVYRIVGSSLILRREIRNKSTVHKEIWETPHLNWFVVTKFLSAMIRIISIIYSRLSNTYTSFFHSINALLLTVNMTEAIVSDIDFVFQSVSVKIPHAINALSGFLLVLIVPDIPDPDVIELDMKVKSTELFIFPLSTMWIVDYSIWNATYLYTPGKSILTHKIRRTYSRMWFLLYSISSLVISMITFYFYSNNSFLLTFFLYSN